MRKREGIAHQGVLYLGVGAMTAFLELVLFQGLYSSGIVGVAPANVIAVLTSAAVNFLVNGNVTFKGLQNPVRSLIKYAILFVFNTIFSTAVISLLVSIGWPSFVAKVLTMLCVVTWNFILYRKVV